MIFNRDEFNSLRDLVFVDGYPGWKPTVKEIPNGDGKVDAEKRYAHIATKYLDGGSDSRLWQALDRCHHKALAVAEFLKLPAAWRPDRNASALRILEYPVGVGGHQHTDFDLFTLLAYRDPVDGLRVHRPLSKLDEVAPGLHFGELYQIGGFGEATPHEVMPRDRIQYSAVYFALPAHNLVLTSLEAKIDGLRPTVGDWLAERYARSRVNA